MKSVFLLCPLLVAPVLAHAAEEGALAPLRQCRDIAAAGARLACFDALAAKLAAEEAGAGAADAQTAKALVAEAAAVSPAAAAAPVPAPSTPLALDWDLDRDDKRGTFILRGYRSNYVLPAWYQHDPNATPSSPSRGATTLFGGDLQHTEAKFQLSFKTKVWENVGGTPLDLWAAYTQLSHWQAYNKGQSAPFRETDYEPELMATLPLGWHWGDWRLRMAGLGLVHQSNGQSDPLSRSWNRVYAMAALENGNLTLSARLWRRLSEKAADDDNPDIVDYMGHGDLRASYRLGQQQFSVLGRWNPSTGKGAAQLDWTFPLAGRLRGYVQAFDGYGESLIDYNYRSRGIGIGLMLNDWLGF
ncbi:phospholipase A [Chromobacterium sp. CV08]|uniref:phospholipase A n=1 Tax=Chromobacterium sp. CV08 TaxID=3133274 RepID=UPI003DA993FE